MRHWQPHAFVHPAGNTLVVVIPIALAWLGRLGWQQWRPRAAAATSERNE
jgi:hypothetical protein